MGSMAMRYITLGGGEPTIWLQAVKYLSIGAILGIPMSYVFGLIDDKVGTVKAAIVLGLCELLPILGLMLQPEGGSKVLMLVWCCLYDWWCSDTSSLYHGIRLWT